MVSFTTIENLTTEEINNLHKLINFIKQPLITNKTTKISNKPKYTFLVDKRISKTNLKIVLEFLFNVSITKINTCMMAPKTRTVGKFRGKQTQYKKVIITLKKGQQINLFENN